MDMEQITVTYDTAQALLADVRAFGGNPLATRRRGLVGRAAWQRMLDALESQRRPDGKLGLTSRSSTATLSARRPRSRPQVRPSCASSHGRNRHAQSEERQLPQCIMQRSCR
jgi:hypothetical protein